MSQWPWRIHRSNWTLVLYVAYGYGSHIFPWRIPSYTELYWVLPSYTEFYRVIPSFTELYRVLPSYTELYRVIPSYTCCQLLISSKTNHFSNSLPATTVLSHPSLCGMFTTESSVIGATEGVTPAAASRNWPNMRRLGSESQACKGKQRYRFTDETHDALIPN